MHLKQKSGNFHKKEWVCINQIVDSPEKTKAARMRPLQKCTMVRELLCPEAT